MAVNVPWTEIGVGGAVAFLLLKEGFAFALKVIEIRKNGKSPPAKMPHTCPVRGENGLAENVEFIRESTQHLKDIRNGVDEVKHDTNEVRQMVGFVKKDTAKIKEDTSILRDRTER